MPCPHWRPQKIYALVDEIHAAIMDQQHDMILGVAVAGSLARGRQFVHDLNALVLHNGSMQDVEAFEPSRHPHPSNDLGLLSLNMVLPRTTGESIRQALRAEGIPLSLGIVDAHALWKCKCLRSRAAKFRFQLAQQEAPVMILWPDQTRSALADHIRDFPVASINLPGRRSLEYTLASHVCRNPSCQISNEDRRVLDQQLLERRRGRPYSCPYA